MISSKGGRMENAPRVHRGRGVLGRGALLVAGALGVSAAASRAGPAEVAQPASRRRGARPSCGCSRVSSTCTRRHAWPARSRRRATARARYARAARPARVEGWSGTSRPPTSRSTRRSRRRSNLEIHTFHLGRGNDPRSRRGGQGSAGHFVILGGTGRYTGARAATSPGSTPGSWAATGQPSSS